MKLDKFDLLCISAAAALAVCAVLVDITGKGAAPARASIAKEAGADKPDAAFTASLISAKAMLEAGQSKEAVAALKPLESSNPSVAETHALLGQAYAKLLDYPAAMKSYRLALMYDPDFVDAKSGRFIGKRIKAALKEGQTDAKSRLSGNASDATGLAELEDARYIERMLAGGCE
jgi:predicted Zn-dependent protease